MDPLPTGVPPDILATVKSNKENAQIGLPIEKKNFAIQKPIAPQPDLVSATPNPNPRIPYNPEKEKKYHVQTNERIQKESLQTQHNRQESYFKKTQISISSISANPRPQPRTSLRTQMRKRTSQDQDKPEAPKPTPKIKISTKPISLF